MKRLKKSDVISVILCLCTMIPGLVVYNKLPKRVVINWGITSAPNNTSSKAFAVFGIPMIFSAFMLLCCIYIRKHEQKQRNSKLSPIVLTFFPVILYLCQGTILLYALGKLKDVRFTACLFVSLCMIVLGNYMPKLRKNWIVGIRTPHIVSNDEVWYKTHRFAGFIMIVCGIAAFIALLLGWFVAALVVIMASVILPLIYGETVYYLCRKDKQI